MKTRRAQVLARGEGEAPVSASARRSCTKWTGTPSKVVPGALLE